VEKLIDKAAFSEQLILRVANLELWLDARDTAIILAVPPIHAKFIQAQTSECMNYPEVSATLKLSVLKKPLPVIKTWKTPICKSETWELWLDEVGRYIFVTPRYSPPPRLVVVNQEFTTGEVLGDFASSTELGSFPLQDIDIRLFVNWLAGLGDLVLHAAGVAIDGRGYCFIGSSGAGKSTLAATLSKITSVTVLGEDQIILRFLGGQFWMFGTPWHIDLNMCSPLGVPVEKFFFLDRFANQPLESITPIDGITRILQTAFFPYYRSDAVGPILDRLKILAQIVPFYILAYRFGADIYELIRRV
jgi:hypothetical protein